MDAQFNHLQQSPEVVELVNSYFEIAVDFGDLETCAPALLSCRIPDDHMVAY